MMDFLSYIRKLFGRNTTDDNDTRIHHTRKRRFLCDDYDNFATKLRRLNNGKMSSFNNCDEWTDMPSTSRPSFLSSSRRPSLRSLRTTSDIIDVSDDDEIVEIVVKQKQPSVLGHNGSTSIPTSAKYTLKQPNSILQNARKTIKNYNYFFGHKTHDNLNETVRIVERQQYRDLLLSSPTTAGVYCDDSDTSTPNSRNKYGYQENSRSRKILELAQRQKPVPTIDLSGPKQTNEVIVIKDSDSDASSTRPKTKYINSMQKILDAEPCMDPNFAYKLDKERKQSKKETELFIEQEQHKRDRFNDVYRESINLILQDKIKNCKITDVILLDEYLDESALFRDFTPEETTKINETLKCRSPNRVFVEKFNLRITGADLKLLNEKEWLNDELINYYMALIEQRSKEPKMPKVHTFNTFFYPKLLAGGHSSLRRWTKNVDIFAVDLILVPVHLGFHWCMAIIDFRDKSIRYYDSMLGNNMQCINALEQYLVDEYKAKKNSVFSTTDWEISIMKEIPRQMNGSDCGVFACTFAEFIARNKNIVFTQEHMPYIRRKMVLEILKGKLIT